MNESKKIDENAHYEVHENNRVEVYCETANGHDCAGSFIRGATSTDEVAYLIASAFRRGYFDGSRDASDVAKRAVSNLASVIEDKIKEESK